MRRLSLIALPEGSGRQKTLRRPNRTRSSAHHCPAPDHQAQKGRPVAGPPSSATGSYCRTLPVELEAHLNLAGQDVLRRHLTGEDRTEPAVRFIRRGVDLIAAEVVVVQKIESFETKLEAHPLAELRGLEKRGVELRRMVPAHLTGAEGREALGVVGRLLDPRIVTPVIAEVRAAAQRQA